jgi:hypothetical protein
MAQNCSDAAGNLIEGPVSRWRPIDIAPKDGTPVDLWMMGLNDGFRKTGCVFRGGGWRTLKGDLLTDLYPYTKCVPTHWMPQPEPPKMRGPIGQMIDDAVFAEREACAQIAALAKTSERADYYVAGFEAACQQITSEIRSRLHPSSSTEPPSSGEAKGREE